MKKIYTKENSYQPLQHLAFRSRVEDWKGQGISVWCDDYQGESKNAFKWVISYRHYEDDGDNLHLH